MRRAGNESAANASPTPRERLFNWLAVATLIALGVVWPDSAAFGAGLPDVRAGSLLLKASPGAEPVEALRVATRIRATVVGNVARVAVTQEFVNPGEEWVDGLYVFPLAADVAVDELHMQVGERRIRGEIRRKAEARAVFEQARAAGRRASLVEQDRPNLFSSSVANIAPRSSITVEIAYLETIPWRDARYTLRLPLAITPRYLPRAGEGEPQVARKMSDPTATREAVTPDAQEVSVDVELAPGFPVERVESLHHPVAVTDAPHGRRIRLEGRSVPADRDFELVWAPVVAPESYAAAFAERLGDAVYALVLLTPPENVASHSAPRELVFIIDTSGSMQGPSLEQAQAALWLGIERLAPRDRFNVIRFSDDAASLFLESEPADAPSRALALRFIASLDANGGTEMRRAIAMALAMPPAPGHLRQIVFITDGAVGNEAQLVELIRGGLGEARLFTVGIGAAPNAHFMREAAAAGRGSHLFIADGSQVSERMQDLFTKLERPALVDLELVWPPGIEAELAAGAPADVYAGDPLVFVARMADEPRGLLTLTGRDATGAWVRQVPIGLLDAKAGVAKLWARERIGELTRRKRLEGDDGRLEARIVELALTHHLVSDYTSLVAVDLVPARPAGIAAHRAQARTSAPAGGAWANTTGFTRTATPAPLWAVAGLVALALAGLFAGVRVR